MLCAASGGERPCGRCAPCRKVFSGVHPDVAVISGPREGKPITVDQVRALRSDAYIRPNEGERKIYLLEQADRMNQSAQNAMLKLLEEGKTAYAVFLLLAGNGGGLLQTVRSRCEELALVPVPPAEAEHWLAVRFPERDPADVRRAALECQGLLGRGVELLEGTARRRRPAAVRRSSWSRPWRGGTSWLCWRRPCCWRRSPEEELPRLLDQVIPRCPGRPPAPVGGPAPPAEGGAGALRGAAELNANPGQLSGWLCAAMFIKH